MSGGEEDRKRIYITNLKLATAARLPRLHRCSKTRSFYKIEILITLYGRVTNDVFFAEDANLSSAIKYGFVTKLDLEVAIVPLLLLLLLLHPFVWFAAQHKRYFRLVGHQSLH